MDSGPTEWKVCNSLRLGETGRKAEVVFQVEGIWWDVITKYNMCWWIVSGSRRERRHYWDSWRNLNGSADQVCAVSVWIFSTGGLYSNYITTYRRGVLVFSCRWLHKRREASTGLFRDDRHHGKSKISDISATYYLGNLWGGSIRVCTILATLS